MNIRKTALKILKKVIRDQAYANIEMRNILNEIPVMNRPFITALVNGVLREYDFLNYQINLYADKCDFDNRLIIICALYERFYMNKKAYAVNNEYVNLARNQYSKAFINALLRKINKLEKCSEENINVSLPLFVYNLLKAQYQDDDFKMILKNFKKERIVYYHLNHKLATYDDLDFSYIKINEDIFISEERIMDSPEYQRGYFYVQDINSAELVKHLRLENTNKFLDACSAPGSKLFNALDIIDDNDAYANDLHPHRVDLIKKRAEELGFLNVHYSVMDACELKDYYDFKFDRILLDVPCSGLGVIGRRPDIKFHVSSESLDELQALQKKILYSVFKLLKDDGLLLYSTCTLNRKENDKQIAAFIKNNNDFELVEESTIINEDGDCFYYALIKKVIM